MKTFKWTFLIFTAVAVLGCSKDFLEENPPDVIGAENLLVDLEGFEAALAGLYSEVREERGGANGSNDLMLEAAHSGTDVAFGLQTASDGKTWNQFGVRNNPSENAYRYIWDWLYDIVNAANYVVVSGEDPEVDLTDEDRARILGEARAIRAFAYRHLINLFGDVPLNLQASNGTNIKTDWERAPVSEVRDQMEKDLLFAKENLPETSGNSGKIVIGFAQHYLAELYLYTQEYAKARDEALDLINNGPYSLITERYGVELDMPGTPFSDMFIDGNSRKDEGNTEVIFLLENEFQVTGGESDNIMRRWWAARYYNIKREGKTPIEISLDRGGRPLGRIGMTKYMFGLYEEGDDRFSNESIRQYFILNENDDLSDGLKVGDTIFSEVDKLVEEESAEDAAEWPYTRKWDSAPATDITSSRQYDDQIYLRLAETYLVLAEAYYRLDNLQGAADAINTLRERVNASLISASDVDIDFILEERARELFSEEHRRYHLLRNDKWLERTRAHNEVAGPEIVERDKLYPIPQNVIDANLTKEMRQNPGY